MVPGRAEAEVPLSCLPAEGEAPQSAGLGWHLDMVHDHLRHVMEEYAREAVKGVVRLSANFDSGRSQAPEGAAIQKSAVTV